MPFSDLKVTSGDVVYNYGSTGSVVSVVTLDSRNQPVMIFEPSDYLAYRNAGSGLQAMMTLSPQYSLDFASAGLRLFNGDVRGSFDHLVAGVTSRDYVVDVAIGVLAYGVSLPARTLGTVPARSIPVNKVSSKGGANSVVGETHNAANFAKYSNGLRTTEAANPLVESLQATGQLPSNYLTKQQDVQAGWKPGKALENSVPGGQIGGDVFHNTTGVLPSFPGRVWYEADIGLIGTMSRSNQPGARLLYSNDGHLHVTPDHYNTVLPIGTWK